ncbi:putative ATPase [Asanoa ferruginea]|uniref:Putative ATPase n=1 Tax=Asanoa ferruginea TaxID=53367 RepID=A0A3D9ZST1_9ACTN|nr:AAA family ATPase [Asanoa ferruginea]REF99053.1 putative ATPase [Asanoa ferruginea]GIF51383.1 LuxR family transcriptional regulator [Asanoa ferruginea]
MSRNELVGRDREVALLRAAVESVADGRGGSLWIDGEPGVGKTSLLALVPEFAAGCHVMAGRASEHSAVFPLRVLLDTVAGHPPGSGPIVDPVAADAERVLLEIDRWCASGPVVVCVDDLQWADDASLAVWARLAEATRQLPLLLIGAARSVPIRADVLRLSRALSGSGTTMLTLEPLDHAAAVAVVERLLAARPSRSVEDLVRQAGGNPLYLRVLVEALLLDCGITVADGVATAAAPATPTPPTLVTAIGARLGFLTTTALQTLRLAAVLGPEFRLTHLALLSDRPMATLAEVVEEGLAAGVLTEAGSALAFRHALIHRVSYESMPEAVTAALHERAARMLALAGEPDEDVAAHLLAAPDADARWVADWLDRASPGLLARSPGGAVTLLERIRAGAAGSRLDHHLAEGLFRLGRYAEIEPLVWPRLVEARRSAEVGPLTWRLAYTQRLLGRLERALEVLDDVLRHASLDERWRARLAALRANVLMGLGRPTEAVDAATDARAAGEGAGDRTAIGWAMFTWAMAAAVHGEDHAAAVSAAETASLVVGDDPETTELRLLLLLNRASGTWNLGRYDESRRLVGEAFALAERAGAPHRMASLRVLAAEMRFHEGAWDDALTELESGTDVPTQNPTRVMLYGIRALIAVHRDEPDDGVGDIPNHSLRMADNLLTARALTMDRDGQPQRALAAFLELLDPGSTLEFPDLTLDKCLWLTHAVRIAAGLGARPVVVAAARACSAAAAAQHLPAIAAAAQLCRGLADDDADLVLAAADAFGRQLPLFAATARENAAAMLATADPARSRVALAEAVATYSDLGATWDIRRADARLRKAGIRRGARGSRRRSATGWESLTPTERTVARLVAQGHSNPDIAVALYLSRNTVQTHVSHILGKLSCHSRREVAAHVATEPVTSS